MPQKTAHEICNHASGPVLMRRVYVRDHTNNGTFLPCGWMCPDCRQMRPDPIQ